MLRVPDVLRALHDLERKMVRTAKVVLGEFQLRLTAWPDRKADAWVVRADTDAEEHAAENLALSGSMRQRTSSRLTAISM